MDQSRTEIVKQPRNHTLGCFTQQKLGVSLHPTQVMWRSKNHEDDHFPFFKIPSSSVFVLALKFPLISQNSAKSCVVLLQKGQLFVLENHDACKNKLKSQNMSYEKAYEKAELQFFEKQKFVKANSNNISILFYPTALCKLGPQKQFSKKRKMNNF